VHYLHAFFCGQFVLWLAVCFCVFCVVLSRVMSSSAVDCLERHKSEVTCYLLSMM